MDGPRPPRMEERSSSWKHHVPHARGSAPLHGWTTTLSRFHPLPQPLGKPPQRVDPITPTQWGGFLSMDGPLPPCHGDMVPLPWDQVPCRWGSDAIADGPLPLREWTAINSRWGSDQTSLGTCPSRDRTASTSRWDRFLSAATPSERRTQAQIPPRQHSEVRRVGVDAGPLAHDRH
jgi:hypothetical protein